MTDDAIPTGRGDDKPSRFKKRREPRKPRKADAAYLERAALWYLERYAASTASLRRVLVRKVDRSATVHGTDPQKGRDAIRDLIERFERSGLLDDKRFAEARARSLNGRGQSTRMIRAKLMAKGIDAPLIEHALTVLAEDADDPDWMAAVRYARRRRAGPYRDPVTRDAFREKDLAALARAGFSYDLARRIVDAENIDDLEAPN